MSNITEGAAGFTTSMTTVWQLLEATSLAQPDAAALLAPGRASLSCAALFGQVGQMSAMLASYGPLPSLRVGLVLPNGPEMACAFLAVAACAVCIPLNPAFGADETRRLLEATRAEVVITAAAFSIPARDAANALGLPVIELGFDVAAPAGSLHLPAIDLPAPMPRARADDTALILHTSGTTGQPKIVPLRQSQLVASACATASHLALGPADRCLNVMPLFHIHGVVGALCASMAAGSSIVCLPGFSARGFVDAIIDFEPTWYTAVPTIHLAVLDHAKLYRTRAPLHRFRFVRSCSAALPQRVFEALREVMGAPVVEAYGMTEATHQIASNPLPPGVCKPGSVGRPVAAEVVLLDGEGRRVAGAARGEVAIRGPGVITAYEGNAPANAAAFHDGWLRTGDEGRFDADGYLYLTGRLKEIVNRGGEKIAPREVEDALLSHPDVVEAVAYGVPHPTLGEDLAAAVVLASGATAKPAELRRFAAARLSHARLPSTIAFVDAIPKGSTGKVQRADLATLLTARRDDRAHRFDFADDTERDVGAVFQDVLGVDDIAADDNFFAGGGDSLKGAQVVARINARFGVAIAVPALFQHPTVSALASHVRAERAAVDAADSDLINEIENLSDEEVARLLAAEEAEASRIPRR
jgi:acyl-CoA synthetase (AMP-forming)/AMP-acid ligase II/acyl carrier protein